MILRFYDATWVVTIGIACLFFIFWGANLTVLVALGFVAVALIFEGMMSVLPGIIALSNPDDFVNYRSQRH